MAWRYTATSGNSAFAPSSTSPFSVSGKRNFNAGDQDITGTGFSGGDSTVFGGPTNNIFGAGAFLRSNAAAFRLQQREEENGNDDDDKERMKEDEEENEMQLSKSDGSSFHSHGGPSKYKTNDDGAEVTDSAPVFGRSQAPTKSLAGVVMSNLIKKGDALPGAWPSGTSSGGGEDAGRGKTLKGKCLAELLSRKLFHEATGSKQNYFGGGDEEDEGEDDYDEDEDDEDGGSGNRSHIDREFVRNAKALFSQVEPELLSSDFVPFEHVVQIIANDEGSEASVKEIEERLSLYYEIQEEFDSLMGSYIEAHHGEFNEAIAGFSEMVLAVSGSDEMLARLKQQLIMAATSFDNLAEQLQMLRMRAAKALLMAESLKALEASLSCESEVKELISARHYLAAVHLLRQHKLRLEMPEIAGIRVTQMLRDYVNKTLETMHTTVAEDLMSCVFRQGRLDESDAQVVDRMLAEGASEKDVGAIDALMALHERIGGRHGASSGGSKLGKKTLNFSDVVENIHDDPLDDDIVKNYLRFIPLCVKTMQELGKVSCCYEAFFSSATRSIEQSMTHFLRLYGAWRQRAVRSTSVAGSSDAATVRVTKLQAKELASPTMSYDEAVALIQRPELSAMLNALFTELEKIVRNAEYLIKVILVSYFPFLSSFLMRSVSFDPDLTYRDWNVSKTPLQNPNEMQEIFTSVLSRTLSKHGDKQQRKQQQEKEEGKEKETVEVRGKGEEKRRQSGEESGMMLALKRLIVKLDVDQMFPKIRETTGGCVCLRNVLDAIDEAAKAAICEFPEEYGEKEVMACRKELVNLTTSMVLEAFHRDVKEMHSQWDLRVLSSQLSYHVEMVLRVLGDAKESEEDFGDEVALKPFLKHRNLVGFVQRTAEMMSNTSVDTFSSLEKMLSAQHSTGVLSVMEQTGCVSFSLVAAVKYAQKELKRANNNGQLKQSRANSITGIGTSFYGRKNVGSLLLQQATKLSNWFVPTPMNIITCYECVRRFYQRCGTRAPRFVTALQDDMGKPFYHFLQKTYIPTLYVFHVQQLKQFFNDMFESESFTDESSANADNNKPQLTLTQPSQLVVEPPMHRQKAQHEGIKWPIITLRQGGESGYPILACVHYIGQVLQKIARISRPLPNTFAEDVQQNITETLLMELTMFLKKKFYIITNNSLYHHLLYAQFEEAFSGQPSKAWQALSDETHLFDAYTSVDVNLFKYYAYNNETRTSGHQYSHVAHDFAGYDTSDKPNKETNEGGINSSIGSIPASQLALKGNGVVVALAIICHSMEWLCGVVRQTIWKDDWQFESSTDCLIPGTMFLQRYERWMKSAAAVAVAEDGDNRWVRLGGILRQMYTLSQACLFYLSLEARFAAFQFIPQLRDESYNVVATARSPDTFVQAYNRRIINFFALLKRHLSEKKLKFVGLTIAKPLSDLIMVEIAHLRDKTVSPAGLSRLKANLLSLETALQLVLPTDDDVRDAVKHYFARPATFLRYLPNKDVANDLVTSGDYKYFSLKEMEELVRLVFRQEANDDVVAAQIELLRTKLGKLGPAAFPLPPPEQPQYLHDNAESIDGEEEEAEEEVEEEELEEEEEEEEEEETVVKPMKQRFSHYVDPAKIVGVSSSTTTRTPPVRGNSSVIARTIAGGGGGSTGMMLPTVSGYDDE